MATTVPIVFCGKRPYTKDTNAWLKVFENMEANGIDLDKMNMTLLENIEELTLYTLEQERKLQRKDIRIKEIGYQGWKNY